MRQKALNIINSKAWLYLFWIVTALWLGIQVWAAIVLGADRPEISIGLLIMAAAFPAALYGMARGPSWVLRKALS